MVIPGYIIIGYQLNRKLNRISNGMQQAPVVTRVGDGQLQYSIEQLACAFTLLWEGDSIPDIEAKTI